MGWYINCRLSHTDEGHLRTLQDNWSKSRLLGPEKKLDKFLFMMILTNYQNRKMGSLHSSQYSIHFVAVGFSSTP